MSDLKDKILKLRKENKSYKDISNILHCSKGTISFHCKKIENNDDYSAINRNFGKKIDFGKDCDVNKIKEIVSLKHGGVKYKEISTKTGVPLDKIKKICRKFKINDSNVYNKIQNKPNDSEILEMQKFYDICQSTRKVSKEYGWSRHKIFKYLKINKKTKLDEDTLKKNRSKSVVNWRKDKKKKLIEYKGGKCEICGYDKCTSALSFHHKDPKEKDFSISSKSYSYERLKKEVDKCILVCANCHIEIHENEKIK